MSASYTTLQKTLPVKNQRKALNYFIQICKGVNYLHENHLVVGAFSTNDIFINKTKATLSLKNIYEININGAKNNF